jgi:hypothetical protein
MSDGQRVVLIPFKVVHSAKHLLSTKGGVDQPALNNSLIEWEIQGKKELIETANHFKRAKVRFPGMALDAVLTLYGNQEDREFLRKLDQNQVAMNTPQDPRSEFATKLAINKAAQEEVNRREPAERANESNMFNRTKWKHVEPDDVVCRDSPMAQAVLKKLVGETDVLYIRGHSTPGGDALKASNSEAMITIGELVLLLKNLLRLRLDFAGLIKIYACQSGAANWDHADPASFAQKFADAMFAAGYRQCKFFGYVDDLSTWVLPEDGHKHSTRTEGRAKESRLQVFPKTVRN